MGCLANGSVVGSAAAAQLKSYWNIEVLGLQEPRHNTLGTKTDRPTEDGWKSTAAAVAGGCE